MSAGGAGPGPATEAGAAFVIHVPAARILAAREARLIEIARNLHRAAPPGTVPEAVRRRFATGVLSEVLERAVEEEVARILAASPELSGGRRVVEDLSFGDSEGLRFRLRVLPANPQPHPPARPSPAPRQAGGAWVALPSGTPARIGDRVICSIKAWLEWEGPEAGAPDLLLPVCPTEAVVGEPGRLPPGWWQAVPDGVSWRVSATGRDFGVPFVELHYRGVAPAHSQITVRFGCREEARGVKRLWLEVPWRLAAGTLPAGSSALLVLGRNGADEAYRDTLTAEMPRPEPMNMVVQRPAAGFEGAEGQVLPGITVWFTQEEAVDFRLRLGAAGLWKATVARLPWPGESRREVAIEIGAPGVPAGVLAGLTGVCAGERREIRIERRGGAPRVGWSVMVGAIKRLRSS